MNKNSRILVAGASGMVGCAIVRALIKKGYTSITGTYYSRMPEPDLLLPDGFQAVSCNSDQFSFISSDSGLGPGQLRLIKVDLTNQKETSKLFQDTKPQCVFLAAAKVGGILANNTYRADFIHDNLLISVNAIAHSHLSGVEKLLYLGSTCIYPRDCPQPMKEEHLLTSPLEYTNEPYAIAKIAGLKMCESFNLQYGTNYLSVMPTNLYGPGDNFDLEKAHVIPAMLRRIHLGKCLEQGDWEAIRADLSKRPVNGIDGSAADEAILEILAFHGISSPDYSLSSSLSTGQRPVITVSIWGTGNPKREFLWSEDMAEACLYVMDNINFKDLAKDKDEVRNTHINIGSGEEISIGDLAQAVQKVVGFTGELVFDAQKPDGTPRKLTDISRLHNLGWRHRTALDEGLKKLYGWYLKD